MAQGARAAQIGPSREARALPAQFWPATATGVAFLDLDWRYLALNEALARIHGIPRGEHVGRRMAEVVPVAWTALSPHVGRLASTGSAIRDIRLEGRFRSEPDPICH